MGRSELQPGLSPRGNVRGYGRSYDLSERDPYQSLHATERFIFRSRFAANLSGLTTHRPEYGGIARHSFKAGTLLAND